MNDLRCSVCAVELFDDPHWDDDTQALVCDEHCRDCITFSAWGCGDAAAGVSATPAAAPPPPSAGRPATAHATRHGPTGTLAAAVTPLSGAQGTADANEGGAAGARRPRPVVEQLRPVSH